MSKIQAGFFARRSTWLVEQMAEAPHGVVVDVGRAATQAALIPNARGAMRIHVGTEVVVASGLAALGRIAGVVVRASRREVEPRPGIGHELITDAAGTAGGGGLWASAAL